MRRSALQLLRCSVCRKGELLPEVEAPDIAFGGIRCAHCRTTFPVSDGIPQLAIDGAAATGALQKTFESAWMARSYERYFRDVFQLLISRNRVDRDSEFLVYRALLGKPDTAILDLGCGTGLFARRMAREPGMPPVIGMDVSASMLEEAVAQSREAGTLVDFVRAEAPELPFMDHSVGAVLQSASLHLIADIHKLFIEVGRVLRPGGRYVAGTFLNPGRLSSKLYAKAGVHIRSEDELRSAVSAAGLVKFERAALPPFLVIKAEKAAVG